MLIPAGTYFLGTSQTFESFVRFKGTVTMADSDRLVLRRNFDLPTYADAFGAEMSGFKRAFQALLNSSDHEGLNLGGRGIALSEPIDMAAAAGSQTHEIRCVIRNEQINCQPDPGWDTETLT